MLLVKRELPQEAECIYIVINGLPIYTVIILTNVGIQGGITYLCSEKCYAATRQQSKWLRPGASQDISPGPYTPAVWALDNASILSHVLHPNVSMAR